MEYLKRVLGIEVLYENKALEHLPNFISTRYDSQKVSLSGQKAVFLYPKTELEQVETLKKHLERVKKVADCPVILVLEQITARQKEYVLREKIAFIVDGKQIYLPFMAAYLQERCDAEKSDREEILPSAQMLLLYYIYEGAKELSTSQAAKDLDLTPTSISRASKQLEGMGFLRSRKNGVQKILLSENSAKELFYKAEKVLLNPVKRTVYVPCEEVKSELLESGYFALAEYSMLNGLLKNSMDGMQPFYSARSLPIIDPAIFNNSNSSVFESISIRDNSIFAECNQLPHKDDTEFDGIYIVPARKGKFKVSVSLMCSEYIEPKVHDIEFEIV